MTPIMSIDRVMRRLRYHMQLLAKLLSNLTANRREVQKLPTWSVFIGRSVIEPSLTARSLVEDTRPDVEVPPPDD